MNEPSIGQLVIDFIINENLIRIDPAIIKPEYSCGLMIWSANAGEQIATFIMEEVFKPQVKLAIALAIEEYRQNPNSLPL